jgi:hypothetical protein
MDYFSQEYRKFLVEHRVFDSWQFINNARKNISTAAYCQQIIHNLICQMTSEHRAWVEDLNQQMEKQIEEYGIGSVGIGPDNMPKFQMDVLGIKADYGFLVDKYIKDFFQYIRNTFDAMAQITNSALLANESKNIEKVDFNKILKILNKPQYSGLFPKTFNLLTDISNSYEFKYTSEFNNLTKHICDAKVIISHQLFGDDVTSKIGPFFKKGQQFNDENIVTITNRVLDFIEQQFIRFLDVITEEIKLDTFITGRIHQLGCYGQKIKDDPNSSFAVVFIEVQDSLDELPDELRILLVNDKDDVLSLNCEYDEILVRDKNEKYIGQYVKDEDIVNDSLFRYRRYKKDTCDGMIALYNQMKKSNPIKPYFMTGKIILVGFNDEQKGETGS